MRLPNHVINPDPSIYWSDNYVVLDFETTNKQRGSALEGDNKIVCSAWYSSKTPANRNRTGISCEFGGEYQQNNLAESIRRADFVVAHNAKFELQWLARCGLDLTQIVIYDTMLGEYVLQGNRQCQLALKYMTKKYRVGSKEDTVARMIEAGICPSTIPPDWLRKYCVQDVISTRDIFLKQREMLKEERKLGPMYTACLFTPVLADMEMQGMYLDKERVYNEYEKVTRELAFCQRKLEQLYPGINFNSPKQVGELLYDKLGFRELTDRNAVPCRTPAGRPKTDADTIKNLRASTKEQREFVKLYQQQTSLTAKLNKSLEFFKLICDKHDSTCFAQFNQAVTATHRLSSSGRKVESSKGRTRGVQFQNFPREFKGLFSAPTKDWLIGEIDSSQLEFRVAGFMAQDSQVYTDIVTGHDVHTFTAQTLLNLIGKEVSKKQRTKAKADTFKPLYGGFSGTPAQRRYYEAFRARYQRVFDMQQGWVNEVLRDKELRTIWNLVYYWPDTKATASGWVTNTQSIFNYPIQGFATGEIIPIGVIHLWHRIKALKLQTRLINTVHDSAIGIFPKQEKDKFIEQGTISFTTDIYSYLKKLHGIEFNFPLGVGITIGEHWGEGDETLVEVPPPYSFGE